MLSMLRDIDRDNIYLKQLKQLLMTVFSNDQLCISCFGRERIKKARDQYMGEKRVSLTIY